MLLSMLAFGALADDRVAALDNGELITVSEGRPVRHRESGEPLAMTVTEHVSVLAASPDRRGFAVAGLSSVFWCPGATRCVRVGTHGADELAVSRRGERLLAVRADAVELFALQPRMTSLQVWPLACSATAAVLVDEDRGVVACGRKGSGVWRVQRGSTEVVPLPVGEVAHMAVSPDGQLLAMAGTEVTLWSTSRWGIVDSEPRRATDVIWTDDGATLLFAAVDGVRAWPRGGQPGPLMPSDTPRLGIDAAGRLVIATHDGLTTLEPG